MNRNRKTKTIIALDTNIFIYQFEENKKFFPFTNKIFQNIESGKYYAVSSIITMLEILTLPKKQKDYLLVKEYSEVLSDFPHLKFIDVNWRITDLASSIRAKYNLTSPDAIQVATAIDNNAAYFYTADKIFQKIKEIKVKLLS